MRPLIALSLACSTLGGCTWGATGKPWSAGDYALQVVTLGMYGMAKGQQDNAQQWTQWQMREVERCVAQGGDPAACRCAVYGCVRSQTNVNVQVR